MSILRRYVLFYGSVQSQYKFEMKLTVQSLVRPFKPWVISSTAYKALGIGPLDIARELDCAVIVAKPSENVYIGRPIGRLDSVSSGIVNLTNHGEMAIHSVCIADNKLSLTAVRLINLLPSQVLLGDKKTGTKSGKLLNHFGYRKAVMNIMPETLKDHAWVATALSYNQTCLINTFFNPIGGGIAGGTALRTKDGSIFRGSAIADTQGIIVSANEAAIVSVLANGADPSSVVETACCDSHQAFVDYRLYSLVNR
jgi:hypothetical protein